MLLDIVFLIAGLTALVWSADQFVLGSSRLGLLLSLPPVVIGAVVMGFGTSAPELLVSSLAAASGDRDLGVGNIVGSNVANLTLVLGTAAFVTRMPIQRAVLRREAPLAIGAALVFSAFVVDGRIARWEGAVLVGLLIGVILLLIRSGRAEVLDDIIGDEVEPLSKGREAGRTIIGLIGTVLGAQLVVWGATDIAEELGVTGGFIGFSLVALGTSLPELVTTVAAARRGETGLIVGNLFGSNIFNALAVGGGMGLIGPGLIGDDSLTTYGLAAMLAVAAVSFLLSIGGSIDRPRGVVLLALYVGAMVLLAVQEEELIDEEPAAEVTVEAVSVPNGFGEHGPRYEPQS
ncbi:calcium/sodium antiporter [Ilumatobacter coccineus]|uniref:Putative transporter n=1 Tax=Ilumatobacter coccineus (strain NBRC 103263 / KCTC 29153 / YM16-304) TaxID=1313172 RepID=A0A6C7E3Z4_ILUCY|nr:calcium/sodium antiporter [Ilumatobacter coccineus]BAN01667.1 putative transporter [Ilumatobacter coccineus YM16-304]